MPDRIKKAREMLGYAIQTMENEEYFDNYLADDVRQDLKRVDAVLRSSETEADVLTKLAVDLVKRFKVAERDGFHDEGVMQEFWDSGDVKDLAAYLEREGIDTAAKPETGKE